MDHIPIDHERIYASIRNEGDAKAALSTEQHLAFIKKCELYVSRLKDQGQLIAAQPLVREGVVLSKKKDTWAENPLNENREVQVGYYHILATDLTEALRIARQNPEFEYVPSASIEVRPIKVSEKKQDLYIQKDDLWRHSQYYLTLQTLSTFINKKTRLPWKPGLINKSSNKG